MDKPFSKVYNHYSVPCASAFKEECTSPVVAENAQTAAMELQRRDTARGNFKQSGNASAVKVDIAKFLKKFSQA